jgi:YHS domain-containing protein
MIRAILYLIATVLVISVLRSVIGVVLKGFSELFKPASRGPTVPAGGELKKDPVCGTFISTATSIQKRVGEKTFYFCSVECRDKFRA